MVKITNLFKNKENETVQFEWYNYVRNMDNIMKQMKNAYNKTKSK